MHIEARGIQPMFSIATGTTSHYFVQQADGNVEAYRQESFFDQVGSARKLGEGRSSKVDTYYVEMRKTILIVTKLIWNMKINQGAGVCYAIIKFIGISERRLLLAFARNVLTC
jgi:hypothetical protein